MSVAELTAGRVRASPYYPALSHPVVRRLLPGVSPSALGDGMSVVAIAWLALDLAPPASRGLWVGAAVAAYTLPGALGAVLFGRWLGRWLGRWSGSRIAAVDAALRAAVLGLTGCLAIAGVLGPAGFVALLDVSSLFSAWGVAGRYTLIAELLPAEHRIAGNTIFGLTDQGAITFALPVHVAADLHGSAALLGTFWAIFGVGAIALGLITASCRGRRG